MKKINASFTNFMKKLNLHNYSKNLEKFTSIGASIASLVLKFSMIITAITNMTGAATVGTHNHSELQIKGNECDIDGI